MIKPRKEYRFCLSLVQEIWQSVIYSNTCTFSHVKVHIVMPSLGERREDQDKVVIGLCNAEVPKLREEAPNQGIVLSSLKSMKNDLKMTF